MGLSNLFDIFYKDVVSKFTYKILNYKNMPKGGIQYQLNKVDGDIFELLQDNCPAKLLNCADINVENNVFYTESHCASMTVQCGYPTHQEFSLDAINNLGSEFIAEIGEMAQNQVNFAADASSSLKGLTADWANVFSQKITNSFTAEDIASASKSLFESINPVNIYNTHMPSLMQLFFEQEEPKKICEWSDFSCHREAFSEKIQDACNQDEGLVNYLKCILDSGVEYISQYDAQEVLNDVRESLPENIVPYVAITSVVAASLLISAKHIINNRDNPVELDVPMVQNPEELDAPMALDVPEIQREELRL